MRSKRAEECEYVCKFGQRMMANCKRNKVRKAHTPCTNREMPVNIYRNKPNDRFFHPHTQNKNTSFLLHFTAAPSNGTISALDLYFLMASFN